MSRKSNSKQETETLIVSKLDSMEKSFHRMENTLISIEHILVDLKNEIKRYNKIHSNLCDNCNIIFK